jgi:hypothetical protein
MLLSCMFLMGQESWPPQPPSRERVVFVSSVTSLCSELGTSWGVACAACTHLASEAGLSGSYCPWIALHDGNTSQDVTRDGKFINTHGNLIAASWPDLTDGLLVNSISYDETGFFVPSDFVWTGTHTDGTPTANCCDWQYCFHAMVFATIGNDTRVDSGWTVQGAPCDDVETERYRWYWFQQ